MPIEDVVSALGRLSTVGGAGGGRGGGADGAGSPPPPPHGGRPRSRRGSARYSNGTDRLIPTRDGDTQTFFSLLQSENGYPDRLASFVNENRVVPDPSSGSDAAGPCASPDSRGGTSGRNGANGASTERHGPTATPPTYSSLLKTHLIGANLSSPADGRSPPGAAAAAAGATAAAGDPLRRRSLPQPLVDGAATGGLAAVPPHHPVPTYYPGGDPHGAAADGADAAVPSDLVRPGSSTGRPPSTGRAVEPDGLADADADVPRVGLAGEQPWTPSPTPPRRRPRTSRGGSGAWERPSALDGVDADASADWADAAAASASVGGGAGDGAGGTAGQAPPGGTNRSLLSALAAADDAAMGGLTSTPGGTKVFRFHRRSRGSRNSLGSITGALAGSAGCSVDSLGGADLLGGGGGCGGGTPTGGGGGAASGLRVGSLISPSLMDRLEDEEDCGAGAAASARRSSRSSTRRIARAPFKVLDAPLLQDDFYLNLVDWSSTNVIAVGLGSRVYLWSAATSVVTKLCDVGSTHGPVCSVSWSPRGRELAVGTMSGVVHVWDASTGQRVRSLPGHFSRVGVVAWSSTLLSSGSRDHRVLNRDLRVGNAVVHELAAHRQEVCGLRWSDDELQLASGGNDNKLLIWNATTLSSARGAAAAAAGGAAPGVRSSGWSPSGGDDAFIGNTVGDGDAGGGSRSSSSSFSSLSSGSRGRPVTAATSASTPGGVSIGAHGSSPEIRFSDHTAAVKAIAWSPHQRGLLASGGGTADRTIRFWNTSSAASLAVVDTGSQVCNLAWARNVNELVSTHGYSQNQVVVWRYPALAPVVTLTGHTWRVLYLAVNPTGETIVTGAGDETLRFWNLTVRLSGGHPKSHPR
ncbi:hypothetical protein I4F81_011659 [Pyropia yezoensis]|uniref:Uncharacterized protein n=1 Tax=Pyropia yezoensis TaxID=2788 RepID=A0ACC3CH90_PYRYE|nr:hypothetical protein I4F81_011659 [Neopyropia yezoensis]